MTQTSMGQQKRLPTNQLTYYHANPRIADTKPLQESIRKNGQYRPIIVNKGTTTGTTNEVLAGNHTLKAIQELNAQYPGEYVDIDCWIIDVGEEQAKRIVLADNRTADLGTYADDLLINLLQSLDNDLTGTGYDDQDLLELLEKTNNEEEAAAAEADAEEDDIAQSFSIVVECENEQQQADLLAKFMEEGLECRAIM
ncbi:ParB N-terminal domain-containing protein [Corynebacterium pyruviciproducens]